MKRPKKGEYAPFHEAYLKLVPPRGTVQGLLKKTLKDTRQLLGSLPSNVGDFSYATDKWTVKQMLVHLIDTERVFAYRTLSFMRGDHIGLPGFNQDFWMEQVNVSGRTIGELLQEWKAVRDNTIYLCQQCTEQQSQFCGTASNWKVSVRAYFFIIIGHHLHHVGVLRDRYLSDRGMLQDDERQPVKRDGKNEGIEAVE
jgi:DinB superfamily